MLEKNALCAAAFSDVGGTKKDRIGPLRPYNGSYSDSYFWK